MDISASFKFRPSFIKCTALSLLSALLLSAGWLSFNGLWMLVAFVPMLIISGSLDSSRRSFWAMWGWLAVSLGIWSGVTTWWIWYAAPIGAILSVLITVGMMGGAFMLFHYVSKRAPKSLAYTILVCGWIALEYLYTVGEVSFPWLILGNGFANDVPFIQWYSYTGVFGGSLWVLLSNLFIYELFIDRKSRSKRIAALICVLLPVVVSLTIYFTYTEKGDTLTLQVVQPNIDPYTEKFSTDIDQQVDIMWKLVNEAPAGVDYVVLPETAIDDRLWENNLDSAEILTQFADLAARKYPQTQFIVGATTFREYTTYNRSATARTYDAIDFWYDVYNSALSIDSSGMVDVHHKSKLVVGVEKMPYRSVLKYLDFLIVDLGGTTGQLGLDSVRKVFVSPRGTHSGAAICYESIYGAYFSQFVQNGAQIMFVITNDGWWKDTPGYKQHFSFSRLRAIEVRRSIARSANTGTSGFINSRGDVVSSVGWDQRASITGELKTNSQITFYAVYGDYIASLCCYILVLSLLYYLAYRIRKRNHLVS